MNQATKDRWIAELRNPKRKQAYGVLTAFVDGQRHDCCLGVLCDVMEVPVRRTEVSWHTRIAGNSNAINDARISAYDFGTDNDGTARGSTGLPSHDFMDKHNLTELNLPWENDSNKLKFHKIADLIEKNLIVTED